MRSRLTPLAAALAFGLLPFSGARAAPPTPDLELTINGGFDGSLLPWQSSGAQWVSQDINATLNSGSALLDIVAPYAGELSQCVTAGFGIGDRVTATAWYTGAGAIGTIPRLAIVYYPNASCLGSAIHADFLNFDGTLPDQISARLGFSSVVPIGTVGIKMDAAAFSAFVDKNAQVLIDKAHLKLTDRVFSDNFQDRL